MDLEPEDEHVDTCRICAAPAEPGAPLFYPCKCSGTIRYIHQDCLATWLAHSKKKSCDLCNHPYSFTKVYDPNMPVQIPVRVFIRRMITLFASAIILSLRAILVATVWLGLVPYGTVWAWRAFFWMGEQVAWLVYGDPRSPYQFLETMKSPLDSTSNSTDTAPINGTSPTASQIRIILRKVSTDIFTGQIIASLVVITFLAVFLLREWIIQNARPGVFDDEIEPLQVEGDALQPGGPLAQPIGAQLLDAQPAPFAGPGLQQDNQVRNRAHPIEMPIRDLRPAYLQPRLDDRPANALENETLDFTDQEEEEALETRGWQVREATKRRVDGPSTDPHLYSPPPSPTDQVRKRPRVAPPLGFGDLDDPYWSSAIPQNHVDSLVSGASSTSDPDANALVADIRTLTEEIRTLRASAEYKMVQSATLPTGHLPLRVNIDPTKIPLPPSPKHTSSDDDYSLVDFGSSRRAESSGSSAWSEASMSSALASKPLSLGQPPKPTSLPPVPSEFEFTFTANPSSSSKGKGRETSPIPDPGHLAPTPPNLLATPPPGSPHLLPRPLTPLERPGHPTRRPPLPPTTPATELPPIVRPTTSQTSPARTPPPVLLTDFAAGATSSTGAPPFPSPGLTIYRAPEELDAVDIDDPGYFVNPPFVPPIPELAALPVQNAEPMIGPEANPAELQQGDDEEAEMLDGVDGAEDDMDGALEAIGMRGPLNALVQNGTMMFVILGMSIFAAVGVPFTLGKTVALLALAPRRILSLLHLPIRGVRLLTDPIVDRIALTSQKVLVYLASLAVQPFYLKMRLMSSLFGTEAFLDFADRYVVKTAQGKLRWNGAAFKALLSEVQKTVVSLTVSPPKEPSIHRSWQSHFPQPAQSVIAAIQKEASSTAIIAAQRWKQLTLENGNKEKIFAVGLGYAVVALGLLFYLYVLRPSSNQGIARILRTAVRQQAIVIKVAVFILVELAVFPVGCGVVLDLCTLPLFPDASLMSRAVFYRHAPITSLFYHWMLGTMFMYQFALLLGVCRHIMRKGAIWFIKDPRDQNFHPIRDILERPTLYQIRKISSSAALYSFVIVGGIGSVLAYLRYAPNLCNGLLPLRWNMREPISEIPIDLLFVHTIIPPTLRYFQPKDFLFQWFQTYWKFLSRELRVTSYMFGGRHHDEEIASQWTWKNLPLIRDVDWVAAIRGPIPTERDGGFMRCPAVDNVERAPDTQILVTVNEFGQALDDKGRKVIVDQDTEARNAHRNPQDDYTIVYTPPRFRIRVITFIAALWATVAICVVGTFGGPILIGRAVLSRFLSRQVHDGYSFILGGYLVWGVILSIQVALRFRSAGHPTKLLVQGTSWLAQVIWLALCMGLIIPVLLAFVVEGYVFIPARRILAKTDPPILYVWEEWALGVVLGKIGMRVMRMQRPTRLSRALEAIQRRGLKNPDAITATKEFIGPLIVGMLGMLILPPLAIYLTWRILPMEMPDVFPFWSCFPPIFIAAALIHSNLQLGRASRVWAQSVRDKEFLVEMKLKNLEPGDLEVTNKADAVALAAVNAEAEAEAEDTDLGTEEEDEDDEDD